MLQTSLSKAIRTTKLHLTRLEELGIKTVGDFLLNFPRRHTDTREVRAISNIELNTVNTIRGQLKSIVTKSLWHRRMSITNALISDNTGSVRSVWFNQPHLSRTLKQGSEVILSGKAKYDTKQGSIVLQNPTIEEVKIEQIHTARIIPLYHETDVVPERHNRQGINTRCKPHGKISSKWIREKLFSLLPFTEYFEEFLPDEIRKQHSLMPYAEAIKKIHFPENEKTLEDAKARLAFNELFLLQLAALHRRAKWREVAAREKKQITADWELIKTFTQSLPWPLTNAQKKALYEIIKDLANPFPMSRLLEGDTGSGKTVIAAAAVLHVIRAGFQTCILAPTEILARQHMQTIAKTLAPFGITPTLLVGSMTTAEKRKIADGVHTGALRLLIGTHALLQEHISFLKLGLAVIDEQHRFGVRQRELLKTHGSPHVLSLSATPIPRTLALVLYGDQDLSVLDEMPPGRTPVVTRIVPEEKRTDAYNWIEKEIKKGRQAFIVFPLINESEVLQVKAATQEFERLSEDIFPKLRCGLLHGQMKSAEKDAVMQQFKTGDIQVLVSTAVVEVGVDVPNATIMMIEGVERFGLAQLHQFRGRVGRGSEKSYCFLFPTLQTPLIMKRLHALTAHHSGFKLAEIDLQLRGPGEVYGILQSGIPDLRMASLSDLPTIKVSREAAEEIINNDPTLQMYPKLKEKIDEQENIAIDY